MKIFTFNSFGGYIPVVMLEWIKEMLPDPMRSNPELIAFVEAFDKGEYHTPLQEDFDKNPDTLLPLSAPGKGRDGITRQSFMGLAETGQACKITINTYDENSIRVIIREYDGAEHLEPLPAYQPVEGIPGLYEEVPE